MQLSLASTLTCVQLSVIRQLIMADAGGDCPSLSRSHLAVLIFSNLSSALVTLILLFPHTQHPHLHTAPLYTLHHTTCSHPPAPLTQPPSSTSSQPPISPPSPTASTPSASSISTSPSFPSSPSFFNVCSSASSYPVPLPDSVRSRWCNQANPSRWPYRRSTRYSPTDLAMSLLTVDAYKMDRDEGCLQSWLTPLRTPLAYFGVSIPRDERLLQPTILIPHTDDSYLSNLNKTFIALHQLHQLHPDAAWYMQTSDDAYMDVDTLLLRLDPYDSNEVLYIGGATSHHRPCWLTGTEMDFIGGGLGFIVSHGFMQRYAAEIEDWIQRQWLSQRGRREELSKYGDLMVGCFMHQHHIPVTHIEGGHPEVPHPGDDGGEDFPSSDHRWWGWHHLGAQELVEVHLLFTLQRIDQLQAHRQWEELASFARQLAAEQQHRAMRSLRLLAHIREHRQLLDINAAIQQEGQADLRG